MLYELPRFCFATLRRRRRHMDEQNTVNSSQCCRHFAADATIRRRHHFRYAISCALQRFSLIFCYACFGIARGRQAAGHYAMPYAD